MAISWSRAADWQRHRPSRGAQSPITLRFNVADVDERAEWLRGKGVTINVSHWDWGTIGTFIDPDGNRCELRNHFDGTFRPEALIEQSVPPA